MSSQNTVTQIGNVTRDPELRFLPNGAAVCTFGLAVNKRWLNKTTNDWDEKVSFFDVTCWRDLADNVAESVSKGSRVIVTGELEQQTWDTPEGEKRYKIHIVADEVGPSLRWATAVISKTERVGAMGKQAGPGEGPSYDEEPF